MAFFDKWVIGVKEPLKVESGLYNTSYITPQDGPLLVINGLITNINGRKINGLH